MCVCGLTPTKIKEKEAEPDQTDNTWSLWYLEPWQFFFLVSFSNNLETIDRGFFSAHWFFLLYNLFPSQTYCLISSGQYWGIINNMEIECTTTATITHKTEVRLSFFVALAGAFGVGEMPVASIAIIPWVLKPLIIPISFYWSCEFSLLVP